MSIQYLPLFENTAAWQPVVSGRADLRLSGLESQWGAALQLDFDFRNEGGFVVARRECRHRLPPSFVLRFRLQGHSPVNTLEVKLVDVSGRNVWRCVLQDLRVTRRWRDIEISSHDIDFAWGPASGGILDELGAFEFAWVAGQGGAGQLQFTDMRIEDCSVWPLPQFRASSDQVGAEAFHLLESGWRPAAHEQKPWIELSWPSAPALGGLQLRWLGEPPRRGFRICALASSGRWRSVYRAHEAAPVQNVVYLPQWQGAGLRIELEGACDGLALELEPFEFSRSIEAFWHSVAARAPQGRYPRWLLRRQCLWTPVGAADGSGTALLSKDGAVEARPAAPMLEPMLRIDGQLLTWMDAVRTPSLHELWQPSASVRWEVQGWQLDVTVEAIGSGCVSARYCLSNVGAEAQQAELLLLLRPFQVNPPWQRIGAIGGVAPVRRLALEGELLQVDGAPLWRLLQAPDVFAARSHDAGGVDALLESPLSGIGRPIEDRFGYAHGLLLWRRSLAPGESLDVTLVGGPDPAAADPCQRIDWSGVLRGGEWHLPQAARPALDALRTAACHVLMTRDGAALHPGPRRYSRAWIRDGAIMGSALLRMGRTDAALAFLRWYRPWQREDGFVPCCVDANGADPIVEHDSHGQFVHLIAETWRFGRDDAVLEEFWVPLCAALDCITHLLDDTGLLPVSASHEGYLAQPVHSFWDDFWALRGLRDGIELARHRGDQARVERWLAVEQALAAAVRKAIAATCARAALTVLPGSVEWADFDPTATANAVTLLDLAETAATGAALVDGEVLAATFRRYLDNWRARCDGRDDWSNYTPYEIRIIGALVRLGWRDEALALLAFMLGERRPTAWNQWPEIAWRDPSAPAHVGDIPHTWISAEYVLAVRSLFVHELGSGDSAALVLAAGVSRDWLAGDGIALQQLPTALGSLSYRLRYESAQRLVCEIDAGVRGTLWLKPPLAGPIRSVTLNGEAIAAAATLRIDAVPARVVIQFQDLQS